MDPSALDYGAAVPLATTLIGLFVTIRVVNAVRALIGGRV